MTFVRFAALAMAGAFLVGCGEEKVGCSEPATIDALQNIVRGQIKNGQTAVMFDSEKTTISLEAVRTRQSTDRSASCAAKLNYDLAFNAEGGLDFMKAPADKLKQIREEMNRQMATDITYEVERLDKEKGVYVTAKGLRSF